jgi:acyl-CoA synthetase (AMP-forming)/AMP-acid ligase II
MATIRGGVEDCRTSEAETLGIIGGDRIMLDLGADPAIARRDGIGAGLHRAAPRDPARVALRFGERAWTYAALDAAANRVARRLSAAGLAPGERCAMYGRNSDAYLLGWLGCARAGLIHVPVNYALRSPRSSRRRPCGSACSVTTTSTGVT